MEKLNDKLADKTLELFSKELSEGVEVPGPGAAAAYTAALGISLGMRACAPAPDKTREALEAMRGYCMRQAVEDGKMLRPLLKLMSEPESERDGEHFEAALRLACQPQTEVMYTAARAIEMFAALAADCPAGALVNLTAGTELCRGAMLSAEQVILENAAHITDDVFAMTLRIEGEKVNAQFLPVADKTIAAAAECMK